MSTRWGRSCDQCGFTMFGGQHMKKYDAFWCPPCDAWIGEPCPDPKCQFCAARPAKPSMVPEADRAPWEA